MQVACRGGPPPQGLVRSENRLSAPLGHRAAPRHPCPPLGTLPEKVSQSRGWGLAC